MIDELTKELQFAMKSQPGMQVIDLIYAAAEFAYPTRMGCGNKWMSRKPWKLSNDDILNALKKYNRARSKDAARYLLRK